MKLCFALSLIVLSAFAFAPSRAHAAETRVVRCERISSSLDNPYFTERSVLEAKMNFSAPSAEVTRVFGVKHTLWNYDTGALLKTVGIYSDDSNPGFLRCSPFTRAPAAFSCEGDLAAYPSYVKLYPSASHDGRLLLEMQTIYGSTFTWFENSQCSVR